MTREIKFRAWNKKNKLFITNDDEFKEYMIGLDGKFYRMDFYSGILGYEDGNLIWNELKDIILMQYTGLKDENGKEIYEGDIIKHSYNDEKFIVPNFTPISRLYEATSIKPHYYGNDDWMSFSEVDWEVIGNIYQNPELLKEEENDK